MQLNIRERLKLKTYIQFTNINYISSIIYREKLYRIYIKIKILKAKLIIIKINFVS